MVLRSTVSSLGALRTALVALLLFAFASSFSVAQAQVEFESGDWTLSLSGNVNAHYIYTVCDDDMQTVDGNPLLCSSQDNKNAVANGLLPANLNVALGTTQAGYDIGVHFGFWPGTVANSGVDDFSGIDMRQVFLTFGNENIGTFKLGRDFGRFAFDPIINDISIPGVGPTALIGSPLNTSLAGIGYGYIYADRLSQIDYTTPDVNGFTASFGVFQPYDLRTLGANSIGGASGAEAVDTGSRLPGFQTRLHYAFEGTTNGFVSTTLITQSVDDPSGAADYQALGVDGTAKINVSGFSIMGYGYYGSGLGTTGLLFDAVDLQGNERDSYGGLVQLAYSFGDTRIGANGGISILDQTENDPDTNLNQSYRITGGVYHSLTPNLQLLFETSFFGSDNFADDSITNIGLNAGAFLSF